MKASDYKCFYDPGMSTTYRCPCFKFQPSIRVLALDSQRIHSSALLRQTKKGWDQANGCSPSFVSPSVLCCCWLGNRKDILPVKNLRHLSPKVIFCHKWRKKTKA